MDNDTFPLWNDTYGALRLATGPHNMWTGHNGMRYGQFVSPIANVHVNLPLSQVKVT